MYEYEFRFSVNLAKVVAAVDAVINEINGHMASFGFPEKLVIRSDLVTARLSGVREFTAEDKIAAANILLTGLREKFPNFGFEYEGCVRYPALTTGEDYAVSDD